MTLPEKTREIVEEQEGQEEQPRGSNSGPMVDAYLKAVHLPPGNPWCAAGVSWSVYEAVKAVGGPPQFRGSGSALGLAQANPHLIVDEMGDDALYIFVMEHKDKVHGHAGFIYPGEREDGTYRTFEFNSNDDGSREGYKACFHQRRLSEIKHIIRIG